jgi:menaquinone-dependent protoporphyrinogen IX oxidase
MKKVLVLYYSQSGQLKNVIESFISELPDDNIKVDLREIKPKSSYPYPWPFYHFFDEFPEAVYMDGCEVEEIENLEDEYDLIILGYTVWYLSPSIPITGFLKSKQAKTIFKGKPVVTLIACRDMWVMAQEKMKKLLKGLDAKHIDNVVLSDQGKSIYTFFTTPRWLLSGKKDAFWFFPPAGIAKEEMAAASRFGKRLNEALHQNREQEGKALLRGLGAVNVNGKLIATEKIATRSFMIWGKIIKLSGPKYSIARKITITFYAVFLLALVLTVVPLNILVRKLIYPLQKDKITLLEEYYEQPSGK